MNYDEFISSIRSSRPQNKKFKYSERHHIVPRCIGGTDDEENLIYLTLKEHFIAHKLLHEENPENKSLFYAYWRMCNSHQDIATPEEYAEARARYIDSVSERMRGNTYVRGKKNSLGYKFTDIQKEHLSKAHLGNKSALGHTYSPTEEVRHMTSERMKGNQHALGNKHTDEWKSNMSDKMKGRQNALGYKHTEEQRQRKSESLKGKQNVLGKRWNLSSSREYKKICSICGSEFIGHSSQSKYCNICKGSV